MIYKDEHTGNVISDLSVNPLADLPGKTDDIRPAHEALIVSASGWRKVFAADGSEESRSRSVSAADRTLVAAAAHTYAGFLRDQVDEVHPVVAVGVDTRPTGPLLADIIIRVLVHHEFHVRYLYITPAPEIMAYCGRNSDVNGFAYVSASHNPVGHNGLKFGLGDGGVVGGDRARHLIRRFHKLIGTRNFGFTEGPRNLAVNELSPVYQSIHVNKQRALDTYRELTIAIAAGGPGAAAVPGPGGAGVAGGTGAAVRPAARSAGAAVGTADSRIIDTIRSECARRPVGVVADLNGSARTTTIDAAFLAELGIGFRAVNAVPGEIAHRIVPEGASLDVCRDELARAHEADPRYLLGYMPDNDGDRGNLVAYDTARNMPTVLEAQQVFALVCMSELAFMQHLDRRTEGDASGRPGHKAARRSSTAVVVNGPTSMRIEEIARALGAEVHRAEVGEANVVGLAEQLRSEGYRVRVLGEGSNGGNITHPARVRDPLNTIISVLKLLTLRSGTGGPGLFEIWCEASGRPDAYRPDFDLSAVLDSLPRYTTTSAFEPRAVMKITSTAHGPLKAAYEAGFQREWERRRARLLQTAGIASWSAFNYEGTQTRPGFGNRDKIGPERGGLKVVFHNRAGDEEAFIWMRGSGTEPVFRVLADVRGERPELEKYLLDWQKDMIRAADRQATSTNGAESLPG